jgi:DNA-directed RNA polymerase subunit RPC12/RpoP
MPKIDYSTAEKELHCYSCKNPIHKYERFFHGLVILCEPCAEKIINKKKVTK